MNSKVLVPLLLLLAAAPVHAKVRKASPPPHTKPVGIYAPLIYQEAREALLAGDLPGALEGFCRMVLRPKGESVWTVSVVLLCDPAEIPQALREIREPQPVFVVKRIYEGRTCFRVCAGLTTDRREAVAMKVKLPEIFKTAGPFPVEVPTPCDPALPGAARPAKSAPAQPLSAQTPLKPVIVESPPVATPVGPPRPEVIELKPVPPPPAPIADPATGVTGATAPNRGTSPFVQPPLTSGPGLPPSSPNAGTPPPPVRNPEAEAWFQKGLTAYNLGDKKLAESSYRSCLELAPDKPEALTNLGILYIEEKKYKEARTLFETALSKTPGYSRAHLGQAGALWGLDEYREAIEEARSAVNLDSHDVSAHLTLASFLRAVGQEEEAMKEARLVLLMEPNNQKAMEFLNTPPPKKVKKLKGSPSTK
jgi:hypothetical protein